MPAYNNQPNQPVTLLPTAGVPGPPGPPGYAFGSKDITKPTVRMLVTQSAVATNVVTLTVQMVEGFIPIVGQLIYVYATQNDSGNLNNSSGTALLSVNITAATGAGTVTYAATASNLSPTADVGYALCPIPEIAELQSGAVKSKQFAVSGYGVSWAYTCPSAPSSISIQLEGALNDNDAEYTIIGTAATTTSGYNEFFATLPENVNFVRLNMTTFSGGTNPSIIAKIQLTRS